MVVSCNGLMMETKLWVQLDAYLLAGNFLPPLLSLHFVRQLSGQGEGQSQHLQTPKPKLKSLYMFNQHEKQIPTTTHNY